MATLTEQQKLQADKARFEAEYKATIAERRRVIRDLNNPRLSESERNSLNVQYEQLDTKATQLDTAAIRTQENLNRVTNQINQSPNPPVAGPGGEIPPYANQNTGGNPNQSTATRYQQAVADDQVRINQTNQGLANTNEQIAAAERERAALTDQLRASPPGSPQYEALFAQRNELGRRQAELETQQSALQDDIRVRENSLATNKNNLSLVQEGAPERVSAPPPDPTLVTNTPELQTQAPPSTQNFGAQDVTDTGGVPTQSLADFEDPGFVPQSEPEVIPEGLSPYGEEDDAFDPALVRDPTQDDFENELEQARLAQERENLDFARSQAIDTGGVPLEVDPETNAQVPQGIPFDDDGNLNPGFTLDGDGEPVFIGPDFIDPSLTASAAASREQATLQQATLNSARQQGTIQAQRKQANDGDWRVKLRLADSADYLYKDFDLRENGILWPLSVTNGVVFPYTPQISTTYAANYSTYDLTHSNYRGYFYQNSYVGEINLTATFTAQDTSEANYVLAVIHFFRSVTKMFYGKDAQRGSPPPLVFLQGLGEFQFNLHPCVVSQFNYILPNNVDYIRARSVSEANTSDLLFRRNRQTLPTNPFSGAIERLRNAGLQKGAINNTPPAPPTFGTKSPTYVPTKLDVSLILLPVQTRDQVSKQFSLKQFANGDLIKGGFW